jgi:hypothetical protein
MFLNTKQQLNVNQHAANHHSMLKNAEARQHSVLTNTATATAAATVAAATIARKPFTPFHPTALSLYMFASHLPTEPRHHVCSTTPPSVPHDTQSSTIAEHVAGRTPRTHSQQL